RPLRAVLALHLAAGRILWSIAGCLPSYLQASLECPVPWRSISARRKHQAAIRARLMSGWRHPDSLIPFAARPAVRLPPAIANVAPARLPPPASLVQADQRNGLSRLAHASRRARPPIAYACLRRDTACDTTRPARAAAHPSVQPPPSRWRRTKSSQHHCCGSRPIDAMLRRGADRET